jgi:hypothetical protein
MFGKVKLAEISKRLPESGPKTPQIQTEPMSNGLAVCESERRHISPHTRIFISREFCYNYRLRFIRNGSFAV